MKDEHSTSRLKRRPGFTIVEALVVIVIITVLLTLLLPTLQTARHRAKVVTCASNLHQYSAGMNLYAIENNNEYPRLLHWSPIVIWGPSSPPMSPRYEWLDYYLDVVTGNNGDVLWCTLDRDLRPGPFSPHYHVPDHTDPRYGDWFCYLGGGHDFFWIGYLMIGGFGSQDIGSDWSNTGNSISGPLLRIGGAQDVVLADVIMSDTGYINNHAGNPRDRNTHKENNVAYADTRVQTHYHKFPTPVDVHYNHWDDHYFWQIPNTYWLY